MNIKIKAGIKLFLFIIYLISLNILLIAQSPSEYENITLSTNMDAYIQNTTSTTNFGNKDQIHAMSWSDHGELVILRSLINFDIDAIPNYSHIVSATLKLYGIGHHVIDQNDLKLNMITGNWNEGEVNWLNQPDFSISDELIIKMRRKIVKSKIISFEETSETSNVTIDISGFVQKWITWKIMV